MIRENGQRDRNRLNSREDEKRAREERTTNSGLPLRVSLYLIFSEL